MNDRGSDNSVHTAVIEAVADEESVDPTDITAPLSRVIDPGALDAICHDSCVRVTFEYHNYLVTVDAKNQVTLTDAYRH